jgi:hypothetical protein
MEESRFQAFASISPIDSTIGVIDSSDFTPFGY